MPWIATNDVAPAHYQMPMLISERPEASGDARAKRKYWQQHHDLMNSYQKTCGRDDTSGAKFFKEESAEAMKNLRGWKFVVDVLECYYDGKTQGDYEKAILGMSEPIAPYADRALGFVCDTANPYYGGGREHDMQKEG